MTSAIHDPHKGKQKIKTKFLKRLILPRSAIHTAEVEKRKGNVKSIKRLRLS